MGTAFIVFGSIIVGIAIGGYIVKNPQIIANLRLLFIPQNDSGDDRHVRFTPTRVDPLTASLDDQFRDLRLGEMVVLTLPPDNKPQEGAVTCRGKQRAQDRSGRQFTPAKGNYGMYMLDNRTQLLERPEGWYVFTQSTRLPPEGAHEFDRDGDIFSDPMHGQQARSHAFDWHGEHLTILDVGYTRFSAEEGSCHIPEKMLVKYMLAETTGVGGILYLENVQDGIDRVWHGSFLGEELKPFISRVYRAV